MIDKHIKQAIEEAVEDENQPHTLASRLIAWLEALTSGNEDINDRPATTRRLEVLFEGTIVKDVDRKYED